MKLFSSLVMLKLLAVSLFISPVFAQDAPAPVEPEPLMNNQISLGYQLNMFGEELGRNSGNGNPVMIELGSPASALRLGGQLRMYGGLLFADYTLLRPNVLPMVNGAPSTSGEFGRFSHMVDAGLGYVFVLPEQMEIAPYLGFLGQFSSSDPKQTDESIYFNVPQNRTGFGIGARYAWKFWEPLTLIANAAYYPFAFASTTSSVDTLFPANLNMVNLGLRLHGRILPYLGAELGYNHQIHMGGAASSNNNFNANWNEVFLRLTFEPDVLIKQVMVESSPVN